jgi:hypothetical protein
MREKRSAQISSNLSQLGGGRSCSLLASDMRPLSWAEWHVASSPKRPEQEILRMTACVVERGFRTFQEQSQLEDAPAMPLGRPSQQERISFGEAMQKVLNALRNPSQPPD